jgi:hypothetical protein
MKSILAKLNANDRTHAVMIAPKLGFLDGQAPSRGICIQFEAITVS